MKLQREFVLFSSSVVTSHSRSLLKIGFSILLLSSAVIPVSILVIRTSAFPSDEVRFIQRCLLSAASERGRAQQGAQLKVHSLKYIFFGLTNRPVYDAVFCIAFPGP
jgi:hypothetical protein